MDKADLHLHSTASDGLLAPEELVCRARAKGLRAIAITDHDSVSGLPGSLKAGEELGVEVIPGIELSCNYHGKEIHILGYFIKGENTGLQQHLRGLASEREERARDMINKLSKLGISLSVDEIREMAGEGTVGRLHLARAMKQKGYVATVTEAFDSYLSYGKPAYVSRRKVTPEEGINIIQEAGGVPVLAHPGIYNMDELIPFLRQKGLKGLEVNHPEHDRLSVLRYTEIARYYQLVATGGSDFHGEGEHFSATIGSYTVEYASVLEMKKLL